jgi:hypothetical protein
MVLSEVQPHAMIKKMNAVTWLKWVQMVKYVMNSAIYREHKCMAGCKVVYWLL